MKAPDIVAPSSSTKSVCFILFLVFIVKILLSLSLSLIYNESYYRLWSEQLQWGYFDHPPMIAWWIRAGIELLGDNRLGVRFPSILASVASSMVLYALACEFGIDKTLARRSALWIQSVWLIALCGMIAEPDIPASLFWLLTLFCTARAVRRGSVSYWAMAGVMAGLGCLSKYTCFFLGPGILLWMAISPRYRHHLAKPGPWIALLAAVAVFFPNIAWNAAHEWGSFDKQLGRAIPETFNLAGSLVVILWQILLLGPLLFVLSIEAGRKQIMEASHKDDCARFIFITSAPLVIYMLFHAIHSEFKWHWLAPVLGVLALPAVLHVDRLPVSRRKCLNMLVPASAVVFVALGVLLHFPPFIRFSMFDPGTEMREWPELSERLHQRLDIHGAGWIGSGIYRTNAALAQQKHIRSLSIQINERFRYPPENSSWSIDPNEAGLLIEEAGTLEPSMLEACFFKVKRLEDEYRTDLVGKRYRYDFYRVEGARKDWVKEGC